MGEIDPSTLGTWSAGAIGLYLAFRVANKVLEILPGAFSGILKAKDQDRASLLHRIEKLELAEVECDQRNRLLGEEMTVMRIENQRLKDVVEVMQREIGTLQVRRTVDETGIVA